MGKKKDKRKPRKEVNVDMFTPIDITMIGSEKDPCFGKLYDLSTNECRMCGDNARCAIVTGQNQLLHRRDIESKNRFKDIEIANKESVKKYIIAKKKKGLKRFKVVKLATKKFGENKKLYQQIYKSI